MRKQAGFTLVETLVVLFMFSIGIAVIAQMFLSQNRLYKTNTAELSITGGVRASLDDVDNYVKQSMAVLSSYSTYTASSQVLILQMQSVDSNDRLIASTYDYVVYHLNGSKFTREILANAASARGSSSKVLASDVTSLTFTLNNADYTLVTEVATSITASESAGTQTRTYTDNSKSRLRN